MFKLRKPCKNCPFTKRCHKGWLGTERAEGLVNEIVHGDGFFTCHQTIDYDVVSGDETEAPIVDGNQFCAGALILAERANPGANRNIRMAKMFGICKVDEQAHKDEVFENEEEFIKHHTYDGE